MEETKKNMLYQTWQVNFAVFVSIVMGAALGIGGTLAFWNGKCTSIDRTSRGPVYEIPLGMNASQFATAYNNKVWMMLEAPTRPDRAIDPAVRK